MILTYRKASLCLCLCLSPSVSFPLSVCMCVYNILTRICYDMWHL